MLERATCKEGSNDIIFHFKLSLPQDLNLPFFAYGAFKPGELAHPQIGEYLSSKPYPVSAKGYLRVRDGLPLFDPNGSGNVRGFLLNFSPKTGKLAYEKDLRI